MPENLPAKAVAPTIAMGARGLNIATMEDAFRFAKYVVDAGMAPKGMNASAVLVAFQVGGELGFGFTHSLAVISVINGRASLRGMGMCALIESKHVLDERLGLDHGVTGEGDEMVGWCKSWRKGWPRPRETYFSMADAKLAGHLKVGPKGPGVWQKHPKRMLKWRAVGHHATDYYSDITLGLHIEETARDYPPLRDPSGPGPNDAGGSTDPDPLLVAAGAIDVTPEPRPDGPLEEGTVCKEHAWVQVGDKTFTCDNCGLVEVRNETGELQQKLGALSNPKPLPGDPEGSEVITGKIGPDNTPICGAEDPRDGEPCMWAPGHGMSRESIDAGREQHDWTLTEKAVPQGLLL